MNNRKDFRWVIATLLCALSFAAFGPALSWAGDYRGAEAVLAQASEVGAGAPTAAAEKISPAALLWADLKAFQQKSTSLAPAEAATQWLVLLDRFQHLEASPMSLGRRELDPRCRSRHRRSSRHCHHRRPGRSWPRQSKHVQPGQGAEALRALGLKLLVHTLAGDTAKRQADLSALETLASKSKGTDAYLFNSLFEELSRALLESLANPELTLQVLERKIATSQSSENSHSRLEVPGLGGAGRAAEGRGLFPERHWSRAPSS